MPGCARGLCPGDDPPRSCLDEPLAHRRERVERAIRRRRRGLLDVAEAVGKQAALGAHHAKLVLKLAGLLLHFGDAQLLYDAQTSFGFRHALAVLFGLRSRLALAALGFLEVVDYFDALAAKNQKLSNQIAQLQVQLDKIMGLLKGK